MVVVPKNIDFEMRGGDHPDAEMNAVEKSIAQSAFEFVLNSKEGKELGFKKTYNFFHMIRFYMSRDPFIIQLMQRLQPYPEYIEMEMTQWICPLSCIMCEKTYDKREKPMHLKFKDFKYAMDQFPNLKWAGNNALGDPFTNPDCWKIWKYLDDKDVVQELYLTGFLLNPEDMENFVKMNGFIWAKFSFDASTKKTYEKIRVGSDFDKVVRNIKALDYYKRIYGKHYPEIHFHYLVMKQNIDETIQFIDFVKSLGIRCNGITFSRLLHWFKEIDDVYTEIPQSLCDEVVKHGNDVGIPVYFNADVRSNTPAKDCMAWSMPYIFPDGTVIPCCCQNEQCDRTWQRQTSLGNIFKTPFREIWYGEDYTRLRNKLAEGKPKEAHPVCQRCNIYRVD